MMKIKSKIPYTENLDKKGMVVPFKKNGRKMVTLQADDGTLNNIDVANMVATLYVPNPNNFKFVIFKDGNYENCEASNLEWSETE